MQMSYPICDHRNANFLLLTQWEQSALNNRLFIIETLNAKHALAQLPPPETYTSRSARIGARGAASTQINHAIHLYTFLDITQCQILQRKQDYTGLCLRTHTAIPAVSRAAAAEKSTANSFSSISVYFLRGQGQINAAAASKRAF